MRSDLEPVMAAVGLAPAVGLQHLSGGTSQVVHVRLSDDTIVVFKEAETRGSVATDLISALR